MDHLISLSEAIGVNPEEFTEYEFVADNLSFSNERLESIIKNHDPKNGIPHTLFIERIYSIFDCDPGDRINDRNTRGYISEYTRLLTKEFDGMKISFKVAEENILFIFSINNEEYYLQQKSCGIAFESSIFRYALNELFEIIGSNLQFYSFFSKGGRDSGDRVFLGTKEQAETVAQILEYEIDEFQYYREYKAYWDSH
ncbi:MAG TPA: hypothetical protein VK175_05525 [Leadbetterella sp.]|nr:hypothetical protein [Leadbetterella sp.]